MMLASLGLFVFDLASFPFDQLVRRSDYRHARTPRVGARDASQYLGPGDEGVTLSGAVVPEAGASYGAIDSLRAMAAAGDVHDFVDGAGRVWGGFVITQLDERRRFLMVDGTPRMVDFTVELARVD